MQVIINQTSRHAEAACPPCVVPAFSAQTIHESSQLVYSFVYPTLVLYRQYDVQIKRIATVTGITELSALFILSEIGADMSVFESGRHLCSWAGLTPANNESANKKKSTRCSKAGQDLKPLLIQCALAAVKSKKEPYFAIKYHRLSKRRGKKKAIIAIARMMLTSIYHMLSDNENFHPDDYDAAKQTKVPISRIKTAN